MLFQLLGSGHQNDMGLEKKIEATKLQSLHSNYVAIKLLEGGLTIRQLKIPQSLTVVK